MIGSDDILACFIAGNAFTWEWVKRLLELNEANLLPQRLVSARNT